MNIRTFTSYFDVNRRMPGFKSVAICACLSRSIYTALRLIKCYAVYLMVAAPSIYHFGWWQSLSTRQPEGFPEGVFQFPANARVEMFVGASARFSLKMWVWVWVKIDQPNKKYASRPKVSSHLWVQQMYQKDSRHPHLPQFYLHALSRWPSIPIYCMIPIATTKKMPKSVSRMVYRCCFPIFSKGSNCSVFLRDF